MLYVNTILEPRPDRPLLGCADTQDFRAQGPVGNEPVSWLTFLICAPGAFHGKPNSVNFCSTDTLTTNPTTQCSEKCTGKSSVYTERFSAAFFTDPSQRSRYTEQCFKHYNGNCNAKHHLKPWLTVYWAVNIIKTLKHQRVTEPIQSTHWWRSAANCCCAAFPTRWLWTRWKHNELRKHFKCVCV